MQKFSLNQNYWNFGPTGKGWGKKVYLRFSRMVRSHLGIPREVVLGRFPFNQNVRFEFSATSSSEWNSIFQNFQHTTSRSIPKFSETFSRKFSFLSTLLLGFLEFSVERFAFRKFNSFRNIWKLFREISESFAAVSKFSKVLVQWKGPLLLQIFENAVPFAARSCRKFKPDILDFG